jgi:hypothetical protein
MLPLPHAATTLTFESRKSDLDTCARESDKCYSKFATADDGPDL